MFATDMPNSSSFDRAGPFSVPLFISEAALTVTPVPASTDMTCMAPRLLPPVSSPPAPAAISGIPSLSRSPMLATDVPKPSPSDSVGPFSVLPFISAVLLMEPSAFMNMMCTAPRASPPASS